MTKTDITGPGTYVTAYCSYNLSKNNLIKHVTNGLTSALDESHLGLGGADEAAEKCLGVLENLSRAAEESQKHSSSFRYTQLSSSDSDHDRALTTKKTQSLFGIPLHQPEKPPKILLSKIREMMACSDLGLISLAYQKKIKATGLFRHFAPEHSRAGYEVVFDVNFDISNIVFPGQMSKTYTHITKTYVVAWYMGHLHLFKKMTPQSLWWPETFIGKEKENGEKILLFIAKHCKVFDPVIKGIKNLKKLEEMWAVLGINFVKGTKKFKQEKNQLITEISTMSLAKII
ncbi:Putative Bgh specific protein [Blumeria hordei DH14]|uniref:Putative Bgh specific protein n=1 Tax=Blumeria graminis f. sp. hordei (strain DH14) TaxID=546991 RepID=N1J6Y3_BLUG1|nr:Putative Bgh specific protein [Blumeria hordei DH14]